MVVGIITGAWGLNGHVKVQPDTDFPDRFEPDATLYLRSRPIKVRSSRPAKGSYVVKLDSASNRTEAEALRGQFLTLPQADLQELPEGHYYHFDLLDMAVYTDEGEHLGRIKEVLSTRGNDVYVVERDGSSDLLVPAISRVVREVDVEGQRMTVRLLEGLR
ncbi:MAG: ribosome maturation factor RimM [SAR202 cluster bacterium]|nr:ribosome maturation factor RimM [SAR202 cluster bacterium]MDP6300811.1 ribosome maturation factor RimM [SAR202 cluster bacterium]MDP7104546.1 ribosome maturation factor RimM [SAR202 cluster bacterium]MDP7226185.1 ribosome maturation factor RimM [SAR202 cluster bacterium]MDP7414440.1 ribosome maturation factor RimM [SAR202 cluster bacterium]